MPAENVLSFVQDSWKMRQENVSGDGVGGELSCLHTLNGQLCLQGATLHMGLLCWKALGATGAFVGRSREVGLGCIYIVGLGIKSVFSTVS